MPVTSIFRLARKNLAGRPGRTAALVLLTALLAFAAAGGTLIISGLRSGLASLTGKMGADIMVVPYEAATKSALQDIILQGNPGYFYMDIAVLEKLKGIEGVGEISDQFYLASASSGCCSLPVQIIGLDAETDFTIEPWIRTRYSGTLGPMEILVGNDLNAFPGDTLTFYGSDCRVVGKLDRTGTYLDTSVYASKETIRTLIVSAKEKKLFNFGDVDPEKITSCVLINVADGWSVEEVLNDIKIHVRRVEAVRTQNMLTDIAGKMNGISGVAGILVLAVWALGLVILILAFLMIAGERKREFAVLRAMGASGGQLRRLVMTEALIEAAIGSCLGVCAAFGLFFAFRRLIEEALGMPFLIPGGPGLLLLGLLAALLSIGAGLAAAAISASRISRIDTAFILRGEN